MHLTRKIQLLIDLPDPQQKSEKLSQLYRYQNRCFRAANLIVSHLYVQEMIRDFFYLTEDIQYKLADVKKDETGIFTRSRISTTCRAVCDRFKGEVPTEVLGSLNNTLQSAFSKYKKEYWQGTRSLRNFKRDIPIPFAPRTMSKIQYVPEKKAFCFRLFSIPFKTFLGRDFSDKRILLEKLLAGEIKLCTSQLQLKNGKIIWLAVFEFEKDKHTLNPHIIAEASLSLEHPIVVRIQNHKLKIGNRDEFLYGRLAIQAARKRIQSAVEFSKSGKGKKRKLKANEKLQDAESRYVQHRLHLYSRKLIDFCTRHQAGTLLLHTGEDTTEITKQEKFVLRNWNFYELEAKIRYKAEKAGIELIVDKN